LGLTHRPTVRPSGTVRDSWAQPAPSLSLMTRKISFSASFPSLPAWLPLSLMALRRSHTDPIWRLRQIPYQLMNHFHAASLSSTAQKISYSWIGPAGKSWRYLGGSGSNPRDWLQILMGGENSRLSMRQLSTTAEKKPRADRKTRINEGRKQRQEQVIGDFET